MLTTGAFVVALQFGAIVTGTIGRPLVEQFGLALGWTLNAVLASAPLGLTTATVATWVLLQRIEAAKAPRSEGDGGGSGTMPGAR